MIEHIISITGDCLSVLIKAPLYATACAVAMLACLTAAAAPRHAAAQECFVSQDCVAVIQPYLMVRVCDLAAQTRLDLPLEEFPQMFDPARIRIIPDDVRAAYEDLSDRRQFITLKKGTPLFDCRYDLNAIKNNPKAAKLKDIHLPVFNCRGIAYSFVPVRPQGFKKCYWVAVEAVDCPKKYGLP
jgi:hypothetical protein